MPEGKTIGQLMAIYAELHYMMSSLMLGEWFE